MLGLPSHVSAPWMAFSFPSTLSFSLLETASLLLLTVSAETSMKNWQEAYSLYLPHNAKTLSSYYRTWIMNLFLVCVFLSHFSISVIRCIQCVCIFCAFRLMPPPFLCWEVYPPQTPFLSNSTELQPGMVSCTGWHLHLESPLKFLA